MMQRMKSTIGQTKQSKEEKRRQLACLMIQCAYRSHLARRHMQDQFRTKYRKVYHNELKRYIFQNKKTEDLLLKLPKYFKYQDYPPPRDYEAPLEYDAGEEDTGKGYAIIITNTQFKLGKWPNLDEKQIAALDDDHERLVELLSHEFYGKIRSENIFSLKNPTIEEYKELFLKVRKQCRSNGFLMIYIASHIFHMKKGLNKGNKNETTYLALRSTQWTNVPAEIIESAISMTEFIQMINSIKVKEKTILMNYAHLPAPRKVMFSANKHVYPPSNFIQRLAESCQCPVIASCSIGFAVKDYLKGHPGIQFEEKPMVSGKVVNMPSFGMRTIEHNQALGLAVNTSTAKISPIDYNTEEFKKMKIIYQHPLYMKLLKDWDISPPKDVFRTPAPEKLNATWKKSAETDFAIQVELPNIEQRQSYNQRYLFWKIRTMLANPINAIKETKNHQIKMKQCAPEQVSLYKDGHTLFGKAILEAIKGGISDPDRETSTVAELFKYIYNRVTEDVEKLNQQLEAEKAPAAAKEEEEATEEKPKEKRKGKGKGKDKGKDQEEDDSNNDAANPSSSDKLKQTPVLYIPQGKENSLTYPLFYRCGPPPAPEQPYILKVATHEVTIEWFNPRFEGDKPFKYKIFMRNVTRNFNHWSEVYYPGDITKTKFVIRDLPMGIACQFRVMAANRGGWGMKSHDTVYVTPGENQTVLPDQLRWRRLHESGIFGVMDRMELYPKHRKEQYLGTRMILGWALCGHGFKKNKVALKVAGHMLKILDTYTHDPELIVLSMNVIGWCLQGRTERKVRVFVTQKGIDEIVTERVNRYRYHSGIVGSVQWLRTGNMSKYITEIPEYKYKILFPTEPEEEEDSSDEEEGKEAEQK